MFPITPSLGKGEESGLPLSGCKAFAKWRRSVVEKKEQRGCSFGGKASEDLLLDKVFAVHATPIFPKDGILKTGGLKRGMGGKVVGKRSFRQTLHFALGSLVPPHENGNWEKVDYAVITPLRSLQSQLINLCPYDTFIIGNFELCQKCIILIPQKNPYQAQKGEKVLYYDPKVSSLRSVVDKVIRGFGGWQIKLYPGQSQSVAECTLFPSENLCAAKFWETVTKNRPHLSFGPAYHSLNGFASKIKNLDLIIENLDILYFEDCTSKYKVKIEYDGLLSFLSIYMKTNLKILKDAFLHYPNPEKMQAHYNKMENEIEGWLYIIELDLYAQSRYGISLSDGFTSLIKNRLEQFREAKKAGEEEFFADCSVVDSLAPDFLFVKDEALNQSIRRRYWEEGVRFLPILQASQLYEMSVFCADYDKKELEEFLTKLRGKYLLTRAQNYFLRLSTYFEKAALEPNNKVLETLDRMTFELNNMKNEDIGQYEQVHKIIRGSPLKMRLEKLKEAYSTSLSSSFLNEVIEYFSPDRERDV